MHEALQARLEADGRKITSCSVIEIAKGHSQASCSFENTESLRNAKIARGSTEEEAISALVAKMQS